MVPILEPRLEIEDGNHEELPIIIDFVNDDSNGDASLPGHSIEGAPLAYRKFLHLQIESQKRRKMHTARTASTSTNSIAGKWSFDIRP